MKTPNNSCTVVLVGHGASSLPLYKPDNNYKYYFLSTPHINDGVLSGGSASWAMYSIKTSCSTLTNCPLVYQEISKGSHADFNNQLSLTEAYTLVTKEMKKELSVCTYQRILRPYIETFQERKETPAFFSSFIVDKDEFYQMLPLKYSVHSGIYIEINTNDILLAAKEGKVLNDSNTKLSLHLESGDSLDLTTITSILDNLRFAVDGNQIVCAGYMDNPSYTSIKEYYNENSKNMIDNMVKVRLAEDTNIVWNACSTLELERD